jgi:hypothetical protein
MGKGRGPRKRKDPAPEQPPIDDQPIERQTQDKAELVPPARRPPTAVGSETPPLPPREPPRPALPPEQPRPPRRSVPIRERSPLVEFVNVLRAAVVSLIDLADAAVEAITRRTAG